MPGTPPHLLVVSDLHLGAGRSRATHRLSRREDFFFDEELARFLAHHRGEARDGRFRWHLVIAGDFLDFLQVVSTGGAPDGAALERHAERYGLGAGARETVAKLEQIVAGHPLVFDALAGFVADGHVLTLIRGNHDVELHFAEVREALLRALRDRSPAPIAPDAVRFSPWFVHEPGLLWIEHGCQYSPLNAFRYLLSPLVPDRPGREEERRDDVDLPPSSMFVRYLFNQVEDVEPDADNARPVTAYVAWLVRSHPLVALRVVLRDLRHLLSKLARAWAPLPPDAWRRRAEEHDAALQGLSAAAGIPAGTLRAIDGARARTVFEAPSGAWRLVRALASVPTLAVALAAILLVPALLVLLAVKALSGPRREDASFSDRARRVADLLGVRYVVMGDSHVPDLRDLDGGREYFNAGTWTKVFDRDARLLRPETQLAFVRGDPRADGTFRVRLMEWHDATGEARLLKLFEPAVSVAAPRPARKD